MMVTNFLSFHLCLSSFLCHIQEIVLGVMVFLVGSSSSILRKSVLILTCLKSLVERIGTHYCGLLLLFSHHFWNVSLTMESYYSTYYVRFCWANLWMLAFVGTLIFLEIWEVFCSYLWICYGFGLFKSALRTNNLLICCFNVDPELL